MGSGASTAKDALKPLLMSPELFDGSFRLAEDPVFRTSFTNYIKSGAWLDRLSQLIPSALSSSNAVVRRQNEHLPIARLQEYNLEPDKLVAIEASCKSEKIPPSPFGVPLSPTLSASSKSSANDAGHADLYSGETVSFPQEELLVILFTIVFPIYLSSKEYERFVKYGIEKGGGGEHDESSGLSGLNHDSRMVQTDRSKRAQELLLGCAAYYDESALQEYLREPFWLDRVCPIFHDHPVPLCFTDTAKSGLPIVFANKAFCRMFGFSESELIGSHFSILHGSCSEVEQQTLMLSKIRSSETVKFSITLQSKSKKPLLDLVAQKAVGSYSISAHFAKSKHLGVEVLNMVDDVLIFLSYLVKAPALPSRPSWLPTPIVVLAHAASSVLHGSSPSSARSHSSLSSRSKTNSGGIGGRSGSRNSKGTPTSVRSFVQPSSGGNSNSNSNSNSAQNSYRSFRVGAGARRHSRGDVAGGASCAWSVGAGQHVATDADAAVECSVGETTNDNSASGNNR